MIRPANLSKHAPGTGLTFAESRDGQTVAVVNLLGQLFLSPPHGPWELVDELVEEARRQTPVIIVDFHGEATSEKVAMAADLDGKVTGRDRHAHARPDERRARDPWRHGGGHRRRHDRPARLGHRRRHRAGREAAANRMPVRFKTAQGDVRLEGCLIECGDDGRATRCELVRRALEE